MTVLICSSSPTQPCSSVGCQRASNGTCPNDIVPLNDDVDLIEEEAELHDPQVLRHVLLILSLVCSMFVSLTKQVWTLMLSSFSGESYNIIIAMTVRRVCIRCLLRAVVPRRRTDLRPKHRHRRHIRSRWQDPSSDATLLAFATWNP